MKKDTTKKPFFARLLENQELEQVTGGGVIDATNKYPSDSDELAVKEFESTQKYPSDTDEGGA